MAFKLRSSEKVIDNTPIYRVDMEDGILGMANKNGSILINKNLSPLKEKEVINHEEVHLEQMGLKKDESGKYRDDLDYDDEFVYWKGKKYPRSKMDAGSKKLPWEKEAYAKTK
jgi:hypothetical protein